MIQFAAGQPQRRYASLFRRLASLLYESLLLTAILLVATSLFMLLFGSATQQPQRYFLQAYLWLVAAAYFIWCWLHGGQTLAMRTWRIRLVNRADGSISLQQAIKRYILATMGLMFFGAGFLWALFDRKALFLHDRLTGCQLVTTDKKP